jgi:hypothetical protein
MSTWSDLKFESKEVNFLNKLGGRSKNNKKYN